MKRIVHRNGVLHVETPNGIVNIYANLTDRLGRSVDAIEILPDRFVGEGKVIRRGDRLVRCKHVKQKG